MRWIALIIAVAGFGVRVARAWNHGRALAEVEIAERNLATQTRRTGPDRPA